MKKTKRYPYVQVEKIPNAVLDACLLIQLDFKHLVQFLSKDSSLLRKTNLTLAQIRQRKVSKQTLIKEISKQLSQHYLAYNKIVSASLSHLSVLESDFLKQEAGQLITKELEKNKWLKSQFQKSVEEDKISFGLFVTWLRFHPPFHSEIHGVLEKNGNLFESQTGLTLPESFQFEREEMDINEFSPQEKIDLAVKVLQSIQLTSDSTSPILSEELKEEIEQLKKENEQWQEKWTIHERQVKKKEKEWNEIKRKLDEERIKTKALKQEVKKQQKKIQDLYVRTDSAEQERSQLTEQIAKLEAEKQEWLVQQLEWNEREYTWKSQQEKWMKELNQLQQEQEQLFIENQKLEEELRATKQNMESEVKINDQLHTTVLINEEELDGLFSDLEENIPHPL